MSDMGDMGDMGDTNGLGDTGTNDANALNADEPYSELSAFLDDELMPAQRREVEARLADDSAYAAELVALRSVRDALRSSSPVEAPPGFVDGLVLAVRARQAADAASADVEPAEVFDVAPRRHSRWVRYAAGAAVAAAVAVAFALPSGDDATPPLADVGRAHLAEAAPTDPVSLVAPLAVPASYEP